MRRRSAPHTFDENIAAEKALCEEQIANTPHGPARDATVKKIRQLNTASHISDWLNSPGLRAPD